ncbi:MAG TPA: hypothetical protein VJ276_04765 [Thermoanaerobaculia bacterium]|nr:hypothetical protein [Thermoanaerobaculia bacterium]
MRKSRITTLLFAALLASTIAAPPVLAAEDESSKHDMSPEARIIDVDQIAEDWFGPQPRYDQHPYNAQEQLDIYGKKYLNKTAKALVDHGIRMYDRGAYTPRATWLGQMNPINYHFMSFGDLRVAGASYDGGTPTTGPPLGEQAVVAARLNLDMDLALTATERIHAFVRPFDTGKSFTRYQIKGPQQHEFIHEFNFDLKTLYFEGDAGAIAQGLTHRINQLDLPIGFGRIPLFTQNGIWLDDAFDGVATGITAKNSPRLDISNTDLTFFAGFRGVTTGASPNTDDDNKVFGLAGFVDARRGYFEYGYGYTNAQNSDLSYHNLTAAFSKRYKGRLNNSVRVIGNFGQKGVGGQKTADGALLLLENSIIPRYFPYASKYNVLNFVPYINLFAGFNSPQPLARAADSGGVLKNTGINFESDGLTAYPTLNATAKKAYGGAAGLEYLFDLHSQIVFEVAAVQHMGSVASGATRNQYALGARYQHKINNAWIIRADAMKGWVDGQKDIYGVRLELRRKF